MRLGPCLCWLTTGILCLALNSYQVPGKLSSLDKFMISLSIQNFIPFLVAPLFPSGLKGSKEKGGLKPSRTLWSLPGYKSPSMSNYESINLACLRIPGDDLKEVEADQPWSKLLIEYTLKNTKMTLTRPLHDPSQDDYWS